MSSIKGMVGCAADMGYKALALTDHGSCTGLLQFQKTCQEKGIKPILGMEGYICDDHMSKEKGSTSHHIILLAKNTIGYKNLIYLSSLGYIYGFYYKPRIDFNLLSQHSEGLIVSTACCAGEIPRLVLAGKTIEAEKLAQTYKDIFKDDFYLEIMIHSYFTDKAQEERERTIANILYEMGKKLNIKVIATQDSHYTHKEDWEAHDTLLSIQTRNTVKNPKRLTFGSNDFYLKPIEEMKKIYCSRAPEVLTNTLEIAEKVQVNLIVESTDLLPKFKVPEGVKDEEDYLKKLVEEGMRSKGLINKKEYRDRIRMEMGVIIRCKYTKYFLILWDIINFAKTQSIKIGAGRGSAVSSLCLYVLDITKLDPLKYGLLFERFLNPERISPPDVDMDFDYDRRNEVYNYITYKYGAAYCCQIGTYNKFKARAVIRSCSKALDIGNDWEIYAAKKKKNPDDKVEMTKNSLEMADVISKQIPFDPTMTLEAALKKSSEFRDSMQQFPKLLDIARKIEGTISSAGVHPAGILICKDPIIQRVPLRNAKEVICSQFDGGEVDKLGLLKYDLLALKTLTVIDKTVKMIRERYPDKIPADFDIDKLEPNDPQVFNMLNGLDPNKDILGVFQFESHGMSQLLAAIHVDTFEDMVVTNALYRPGPLGAGIHDMYCMYKHGKKKVEYLHPKMGEVLHDTFGLMVYQESLMKVSKDLAGFTGGQADTLRSAVGKKKKEELPKLKELFVKGCLKNGIEKDIAVKIFEQIEFFGNYGFNKSHSAGYGLTAYQTAWLKYYYPLEFMCNLLTSEINNNDKNEKLEMYISSAEKMKIGCSDPHINQSGLEFKIGLINTRTCKNQIGLIKPLTFMKGVGDKAVYNIVQNQPYKSLEDFLRRTDGRLVNSKVFATLVNAGCMTDAWNVSQSVLLNNYPVIREKLDKEKKQIKKEALEKEKYGDHTIFDEFQKNGKIDV
jgi:DNA polymerase-3 subunit alpha